MLHVLNIICLKTSQTLFLKHLQSTRLCLLRGVGLLILDTQLLVWRVPVNRLLEYMSLGYSLH